MNLEILILIIFFVFISIIILLAKKKISENIKDEFINSFQKLVDIVNNFNKTNRDEINLTLERISKNLEEKFEKLREENTRQLEKMRAIVEEKIQDTLQKRIGESFKIVNSQLEQVQRGLGEMQNLAKGVGDLKKVLSNIKVRGTWGEIQLESILEQILTPEQYDKNVEIKKNGQRVEFAIKLPGKEDGKTIYLPIDSKFPQESYLKMLDEYEKGNIVEVEKIRLELQKSINKFAEDISKKYIAPPTTTDFAIMFLPTEGLYAEVLKFPGKVEEIQRKHRIIITGPTTLSALLNSLRIGFKTLAIEKRSSEVWKILAAVKTEFIKFGELIEKLKKQVNTISNTLEQTDKRTKIMERKLKEVEKLPEEEAKKIIELE